MRYGHRGELFVQDLRSLDHDIGYGSNEHLLQELWIHGHVYTSPLPE